VLRYETLARRFLAERVQPGGAVRVEDLSGTDVTAFLLGECARLTVGSAKGQVAELRALFRFLYLQGLTPRSLSAAVPRSPAGATPPCQPAWPPVTSNGCWAAATGRVRDFAILMLLARLGLRSAEVSRLEMGDQDSRGRDRGPRQGPQPGTSAAAGRCGRRYR